jgi:hypothetical protein
LELKAKVVMVMNALLNLAFASMLGPEVTKNINKGKTSLGYLFNLFIRL